MIGQYIDIYRITDKLGQGGMGQVWKAIDTQLDRPVALKVMNVQDPMFLQRFRGEAKALAILDHPNIVKIFGMRDTPIGMVIIMEFVEGQNWADLINRGQYNAPDDVIRISQQLLDALSYAHQKGLIHRDIKPSNVMITSSGQVKVTDFGLAKLVDPQATMAQSPLTQVGQAVGSLFYMSPEQVKGLDTVDHRTDLYSTGITMYEALAGRPPFDEVTATSPFVIQKKIVDGDIPPVTSYAQHLPPELAKVISKAIHIEPNKRFQSADEMKEVLNRVPTQAQNVYVAPKATPNLSSKSPSIGGGRLPKTWLMAGGLVAVLGIAGLTYAFWPKPVVNPPHSTELTDPNVANLAANPQNTTGTNPTSSEPSQSPTTPPSNTPTNTAANTAANTPQGNTTAYNTKPTAPNQVTNTPATKPNTRPNTSPTSTPTTPSGNTNTEKPKPVEPKPVEPKPTPSEPESAVGTLMVTVIDADTQQRVRATISSSLGSSFNSMYVKKDIKAGSYAVSVSAPGYKGKSVTIRVPSGGTGQTTVALSKE